MNCIFQDPVEIEDLIQKKRDKYRIYGLTLQPVIFADITNSTYYIVFDDIKYNVDTILKAIDVTFKILQVLNLEYPMESKSIWIFIQKYLYKISTPFDITLSSVEVMCNDLKLIESSSKE